jgi:hypothetical protein
MFSSFLGEAAFDFYAQGSKVTMPNKVLCEVRNEETTLTGIYLFIVLH